MRRPLAWWQGTGLASACQARTRCWEQGSRSRLGFPASGCEIRACPEPLPLAFPPAAHAGRDVAEPGYPPGKAEPRVRDGHIRRAAWQAGPVQSGGCSSRRGACPCAHVCVSSRIYVRTCLCVHMSACVREHACVCSCTCVREHVCLCMCACECVHMSVCMRVCACTHAVYAHVPVSVYACLHACPRVCLCVWAHWRGRLPVSGNSVDSAVHRKLPPDPARAQTPLGHLRRALCLPCLYPSGT